MKYKKSRMTTTRALLDLNEWWWWWDVYSEELSMVVIKSMNDTQVSDMTNESCIRNNLEFLQ